MIATVNIAQLFKILSMHLASIGYPLPPRSPNLNAFAERWVKSVKSEVFSKLILFGERSLRHALTQYTAHFHEERPHQGIGNVIPFPARQPAHDRERVIHCQERLGGLLKYYEREAA
jgi:putative transposase